MHVKVKYLPTFVVVFGHPNASLVSYPVPEAIASNVIWTLDTVVMLIFTVIANALRAGPEADPPGNMRNSLIAAVCIMAFFSLPILWLKGDLKRLAVDRRRTSLVPSV